MDFIDLRSDTCTRPTPEMREAMAAAVVGDDVYDDDPTTRELERLAAEVAGFEAALFVPSGTMGNQIAIMAHTRRGDEIIVGENSHIVVHEVGAAAVLAQVGYRVIRGAGDILRGADIAAAVRPKDIHYPDTALVCLENALANGRVVSIDDMRDAHNAAKAHNLPIHMDGARIFNAAVYLGCDVKELTKYCDSLMFCLSKGLAAPVGSMLCGSADFISRAKKLRKLLGGGMRQTGILAACGIIAINKMTKRLHTDHENAQYLAAELNKIPAIDIDCKNTHINLVFFKINKPNFDHNQFTQKLLEHKIKTNFQDFDEYRFVTHNDISRANIDHTIGIIRELLA
ncbi:MAG: low-specificity L-threonine aldolase [Defluviitaleaceae bacterium]|nr:low-specificity L-threonine aldolase [Defluviitaleaceae bacterium]